MFRLKIAAFSVTHRVKFRCYFSQPSRIVQPFDLLLEPLILFGITQFRIEKRSDTYLREFRPFFTDHGSRLGQRRSIRL